MCEIFLKIEMELEDRLLYQSLANFHKMVRYDIHNKGSVAREAS